MKLIDLSDPRANVFRDIYNKVLCATPHRAMDLAEIGRRVKVIDKIAKGETSLLLEDAEHETLNSAVKQFPYQVASQDILDAADLVAKAETPPEPPKQA